MFGWLKPPGLAKQRGRIPGRFGETEQGEKEGFFILAGARGKGTPCTITP